jgi:hypothetical protein
VNLPASITPSSGVIPDLNPHPCQRVIPQYHWLPMRRSFGGMVPGVLHLAYSFGPLKS